MNMMDRARPYYDEPHRRYHTWDHVLACLAARAALLGEAMSAVDLALVYHDAVYDPFAHDNEERSADLLIEEGRRERIDEAILQHAAVLVLATKHDGAAQGEAALVVDADLSILGSDEATFDRYEALVREEYAAIDNATFIAGRRRILEALLARPSIYQTPPGQQRWESRARANLARSLARLPRNEVTFVQREWNRSLV